MCVNLQISEGFAGYGIYWAIIEVLRDAPNYRYSSDPKVWAYVLHAQDVDQVNRVLTQYGLFDIDNEGLLFSPWLIEQLGAYDDKKARLQEAGRRGAAKRWAAAHKDDGQAIATPSMNDGQAIAINNTQYNITEYNSTQPSEMSTEEVDRILSNPGNPVTSELVEAMSSFQSEGHAPGFLAQVCKQYGMGENVLEALQRLTNNGDVQNPKYKQFLTILGEMQAKKWKPNMPANYFLRKLTR